MNKAIRQRPFLFAILFTLSGAILLSLFCECLICFLGFAMAATWDGDPGPGAYPRFLPFCVVTGLVSAGGLAALIVTNALKSEALGYKKSTWIWQTVCCLALSLPLIKLWETFFRYLQELF
jgi:hypothetical protein